MNYSSMEAREIDLTLISEVYALNCESEFSAHESEGVIALISVRPHETGAVPASITKHL